MGDSMRVSPMRTAERADLRLGGGLLCFGRSERGRRLLELLLADHARGRELLRALEVGARERGGGFHLGEASARGGELIGKIARAHESDDLTLLDAVAAIDEDRVDVAEDLRADVGLLERT